MPSQVYRIHIYVLVEALICFSLHALDALDTRDDISIVI
jgi:hypothetical protein